MRMKLKTNGRNSLGPAARSRTRATVRSSRPRCPRSRGHISLSTSPSIGDLISSVRSLVGAKKVTPCRVRRVRAVRAASRKGDSKPRPPSRPAANPAVGKILFRASSAIPVHKRPAFVTRPIQQSLPAIRSHRHASTRCPAEEAGTIVCPETPALHAERGESLMLCEAQPALIVIFKKS